MANETDWKNSRIAWFSALERAIQEEDFELAAEAKSQLKRLGVTVSFEKEKTRVLSKHLISHLKSLYSTVFQLLKVNNVQNS